MILQACLFLVLFLFSVPAFAEEFYRIHIKRIDRDLYRDEKSGVIIQTRHCHEYVHGDDAILVYDAPRSSDNKIIFEDDSQCDVVKVIK